MHIIHMSDWHLRSDGKLSFQKCDTAHQVRATIDYMKNLKDYELPEFFVITGDIAEGGTREGLEMARDFIAELPRPAYVVPGNHDVRELYLDVMPDCAPVQDDIKPYICYTVEGHAIRAIFIDTSIPETHWGGLADPVAQWLENKIKEDLQTPTIVFGHHPPFTTGLPAMDEGFENRDRFAEILQLHPNLIYCCGHLHTPTNTVWRGISCRVAPSVSMQMEVDFRPKDGPDVTPEEKEAGFKGGGDRFFLGNPSYYLHQLQGDRINTHQQTIPAGADFSGPWGFVYYEGEH